MKLETAFARHSAALFNYAVALTRSRDQAAELVQETALRLLSARHLPKDDAALRAWMFTTLRNHRIDQLRRCGREAELLDHVDTPATDLPVEEALSVRAAFHALSFPHREVLAAVDIAGFTYAQTAEILDLPIGTVMSRVARARAAMLAILNPQPDASERRMAGE